MWADASGQCEENSMRKMLYNSVVFVCVMSGEISVCLVCLGDQIRWISCSLTQMFISVSGVSYVSWCRLKLAVLIDSLAWLKCCREETTVQ